MRTIIKIDKAFPITLEQSESRRVILSGHSFRVTYGRQVKDGLTYTDAALELGAAMMHAAQCEGLIKDEDDVR